MSETPSKKTVPGNDMRPVWVESPRMNPTFQLSTSVVCPHCGAAAGELCRTPNGKQMPAHNKRRERTAQYWETGCFAVEVLRDHEHYNLKTGDRFLAHNAGYDNKVKLLFRLSDGYAPDCTQYSNQVRFLCWDTQLTPPALIQHAANPG